jgi:3-isopropylmalate dehydrogenase
MSQAPDATTLTLGYWDGEGIGPEITPPTRTAVDQVLAAEHVGVTWVPLDLGIAAFRATGQVVPDATLEQFRGLDGWVLGPHDNVSYPPAARAQLNPSAALRQSADLWANIRPVVAVPGAPAPDLDVTVVRENTEGMYADRNMAAGSGDLRVTTDVSLAVGVFTRHKIARICDRAAQIAASRGGVLTVAHKSNVLTRTSGMYLEEAERAAAETGVDLCPVHVDALCADLVRRPARHRTIVAENMFGDILSDLTAALGGSLGAAGSINAGDRQAMAQAAHGAAPDIAGQGIANPAGLMNSAAQLLTHLGYPRSGEVLAAAVRATLQSHPTPDMAGAGVGAGVGAGDGTGAGTGAAAPAVTTAEFSDGVFAAAAALV